MPAEVPGSVVEEGLAGGMGEREGPLLGVLDLGLIVLGVAAVWWLWRRDVIRPGSFRRLGRDRRLARDAAMPLALGLLVVFFAQQVGAGLGAATAHLISPFGQEGGEGDLARSALLACGAGVAGVAAGLGMLLVISGAGDGGRPAANGLRFPLGARELGEGAARGLKGLLVALPIVHLVSVAAVLVTMLWREQLPDVLAHDTLRQMVEHLGSPWVWALGFAVVVLAPIAEELVFRVFLQSLLLKAMGSTWAAVLVSSAIFAAVHFGFGVTTEDVHALPALFVLGVAMGVAYERSRSMVAPMVMHIGFNGLNVGLAVLAV